MNPERTRLFLNVLSVEEVLALLDLKMDKAAASPCPHTPAPALEPAFFGSGSDAALVFDGTSTVLGVVPSANVYTLNRSIFAASIILQPGVTVKTAGFRIFVTGTLTNHGTISNAGNNGASATNQNSVGGGAAITGIEVGGGTVGGGGSAGSTANGTAGGVGGTAGNSGGGAGAAGGASGGVPSVSNGANGGAAGAQTVRAFRALNHHLLVGASLLTGGSGGGGGAGAGGGGGSSYGGAGGGGGGGGGGFLYLVYTLYDGTGLLTATGGLGGTAGMGNGTGTAGVNGGNGAPGTVLRYNATKKVWE